MSPKIKESADPAIVAELPGVTDAAALEEPAPSESEAHSRAQVEKVVWGWSEVFAERPRAKVLDQRLLDYEWDMQNRFLAGDIEERCEFCLASADPVIASSAMVDVETRLQAARLWRKRAFTPLRGKPTISNWLADDRENVSAAWAGEIPLREIDRMASASREKRQLVADGIMEGLRIALCDCVNSRIEDVDPEAKRPQLPRVLVFRDDGSFRMYSNEGAARADNFPTSKRFIMMIIDPSQSREFEGEMK